MTDRIEKLKSLPGGEEKVKGCKECLEQARLLGMSGERESALLAKFNRMADAERVCAWIRDKKRKPANIAFTEGPERQIAYAVEELINLKFAP